MQDVHHYHSFREMLEAESLKEVLPGVDTTEEGRNLLLYGSEDVTSHSICFMFVGTFNMIRSRLRIFMDMLQISYV